MEILFRFIGTYSNFDQRKVGRRRLLSFFAKIANKGAAVPIWITARIAISPIILLLMDEKWCQCVRKKSFLYSFHADISSICRASKSHLCASMTLNQTNDTRQRCLSSKPFEIIQNTLFFLYAIYSVCCCEKSKQTLIQIG